MSALKNPNPNTIGDLMDLLVQLKLVLDRFLTITTLGMS